MMNMMTLRSFFMIVHPFRDDFRLSPLAGIALGSDVLAFVLVDLRRSRGSKGGQNDNDQYSEQNNFAQFIHDDGYPFVCAHSRL